MVFYVGNKRCCIVLYCIVLYISPENAATQNHDHRLSTHFVSQGQTQRREIVLYLLNGIRISEIEDKKLLRMSFDGHELMTQQKRVQFAEKLQLLSIYTCQ